MLTTTLAAGASLTTDTTVNIPPDLAPGTYYLGTVADKNEQQPETVETNNSLAGATLTITP